MILKRFALYGITGIITFIIGYSINDYYSTDRTPVQPIEFSHQIHAGTNRIPCKYCHIYVERSRVAGVPSVQRCIGCHSVIKVDALEIKKLTSYWEDREPIPWVKVHNLPDYVYFPHKRHIKAGLECQMCHGDVASMKRVTRVSSLQMGWCLDYHKKREVKNGRDCWFCHQ